MKRNSRLSRFTRKRRPFQCRRENPQLSKTTARGKAIGVFPSFIAQDNNNKPETAVRSLPAIGNLFNFWGSPRQGFGSIKRRRLPQCLHNLHCFFDPVKPPKLNKTMSRTLMLVSYTCKLDLINID